MSARLTAVVLAGALIATFLLWPEEAAVLPAVSVPPPSLSNDQPELRSDAGEIESAIGSTPIMEITMSGAVRRRLLWNRVKRDCPWPPEGDSWLALDAECGARMAQLFERPGVPKVAAVAVEEALADPLGTRAAVAAALQSAHCIVPQGEAEHGLEEACAAEEMVRLARLHQWCGSVMGQGLDFRAGYVGRTRLLEWELAEAAEWAVTQEDYYLRAERAYQGAAVSFYTNHLCRRLPPPTLEPLDLLPASLAEVGDQRGRALYELARRLGSERYIHFSPTRSHARGVVTDGETEAD